MKTILEGFLDYFPLPAVLQFLSMNQKTGSLNLSAGSTEIRIFLQNGEVTYAVSNQEKFRLSNVLLRRKKIDAAQQRRIEQLMSVQGEKFGKIAVEEGILSEGDLQSFLKIQASEIIYETFAWNEGHFHFIHDVPPPGYAVSISIDLTNLIMEGARRMDEMAYFLQRLPGNNAVFEVVPNPEVQDNINLSLQEWRILFLINGKRTVQDLCRESADEELDVYKVVYGLHANNLIAVVPEDGQPPAPLEPPDLSKSPEAPRTHPGGADTPLLISSEARLTWKEILKVSIAQLTWNREDGEAITFPLTETEHTIGRQPANSICLPHPGISNNHARIVRTQDGFFIEDLGSTNGTFVNGDRIERQLLQDNDAIFVGGIEMTYSVVLKGA